MSAFLGDPEEVQLDSPTRRCTSGGANAQFLAIRRSESRHTELTDADLFTEFLLERPILGAVRFAGPTPPVKLIDEIVRVEDEFEALLAGRVIR